MRISSASSYGVPGGIRSDQGRDEALEACAIHVTIRREVAEARTDVPANAIELFAGDVRRLRDTNWTGRDLPSTNHGTSITTA